MKIQYTKLSTRKNSIVVFPKKDNASGKRDTNARSKTRNYSYI